MGEPIGWVVVDRDTKKLDWDGELHPSQEAAAKSLSSNALWQDQDWQPFILYDICPVYPAPEPADAPPCSDHKPVQHRDGKPPWCKACGLTKEFEVPISRLRTDARP